MLGLAALVWGLYQLQGPRKRDSPAGQEGASSSSTAARRPTASGTLAQQNKPAQASAAQVVHACIILTFQTDCAHPCLHVVVPSPLLMSPCSGMTCNQAPQPQWHSTCHTKSAFCVSDMLLQTICCCSHGMSCIVALSSAAVGCYILGLQHAMALLPRNRLLSPCNPSWQVIARPAQKRGNGTLGCHLSCSSLPIRLTTCQ